MLLSFGIFSALFLAGLILYATRDDVTTGIRHARQSPSLEALKRAHALHPGDATTTNALRHALRAAGDVDGERALRAEMGPP